ncbi:MAG: hypothetical protein AB7E69_16140 [Sphingomonadales bacterium]
MNWIQVTGEEAWQHPLYGFGGWLAVIYGIEVLLLGNTLYSVLDIAYRAGVGTILSTGFATVWLHLALEIPFLVMAPMRARAMPPVAIACFWIGVAWNIGYVLMISIGPLTSFGVVGPMLLSPVWGVVFTLYLLRSRRVNVTYRWRVRAGETAGAIDAPPATSG